MDQFTENTIVTVALHPGLEQFFKQQKPHNYKKNERQTVYPIKKQEEIIAMANWLLEHKDRSMFWLLRLVSTSDSEPMSFCP